MSDDDIFGTTLGVEEASIQHGHGDGIRDGMAIGYGEGRELGLQKGYEMGQELGFYAGCARMWRALQAKDPAFLSERQERGLAAVEDMLRSFPLLNPQDESLFDALERLRGRFKAVASGLGCLQDYFREAAADATSF
ncbi:Oral cancer-overexpressed protein 1 [Tetrabaena socialis]|uniref:Oral cancer-overexpressed protein 1 n=1 Tax=Tetrabaena socialis TaxID=47790 RepID=A0A2J7ZNV0_9CHLO|nr:Oral cancer-overexpressed protein 1 [Tetrabaena socialis]|eukprot:PNH01945.1 Oral cancer-overexpressed protein 1 [Tetrabaena socialis]